MIQSDRQPETFIEFLSCLHRATQHHSFTSATTTIKSLNSTPPNPSVRIDRMKYIHDIQHCTLFKQLFRPASSTSQQHSLRFIYDLYFLSLGLRQCVLLDYMMFAKEEKLCQLLVDFSKEWNQQSLDHTTRLGLMKIEFVTLLGGNWEEMTFTYLINEKQLRTRAEQIISHERLMPIEKRLFVNIDCLEAENTPVPCIESSHRLNDIDAFSKQIFKEICLRVFGNCDHQSQNPQGSTSVDLKFLKESFESNILSFIPFDATMMNALLLNYPIILFYGSRFNTLSDKTDFVANHCLNHLNLQRYSLHSSLLVDDPYILQFVIPTELYEENRSVFDSCIASWLENVKTCVNSTHERNALYLKIESVSHDNIVL
ncbi:hypothetical protein C9374_009176 [Naegleria lovaniensis]|uniref:Uncharacterized protein n=1 Tax=Naegleria lovaniensis TaxID=51637 RepID=A0AA88GIZ5_NAELO|nr:uncharacterized protein C9374_009176 [Naegleria lovaniensis]KAG2377660.1 hypothetical protein C9374_009176 [Naegleria lovaniensis]